jgi:hypothetical protein
MTMTFIVTFFMKAEIEVKMRVQVEQYSKKFLFFDCKAEEMPKRPPTNVSSTEDIVYK